MKPFTFSDYYTEWLEAFRAMVPGGSKPAEQAPVDPQVAANQEWECEGGAIKPEK
jgi:hypothetical protein